MGNEILLSNIRELCKKHGITVNYLEKKLEMGTGTISRWSRANPSFDRIMDIAKYFRVSIDFLSGYTVEPDINNEISESTLHIIDYLMEETIDTGANKLFWHDYKKEKEFELQVFELSGMNTDMGRLYYASDEYGYYLLEAVYTMNASYDYETQIRLYLVPEENSEPIMECSDKGALQALYITAVKQLENYGTHKTAKEKAEQQREKILRRYQSQE